MAGALRGGLMKGLAGAQRLTIIPARNSVNIGGYVVAGPPKNRIPMWVRGYIDRCI